jgi:hypothetical protein
MPRSVGTDDERVALGRPQRERLRHELADDDLEEGDREDYDPKARGCAVAADPADFRQLVADAMREPLTAVCGRRGADEGDADLHGGEKPLGLITQPEHGARATLLRLEQLAEAGSSNAQHGDLRTREDTVQEHQKNDDQYVFEHRISEPAKAGRRIIGPATARVRRHGAPTPRSRAP